MGVYFVICHSQSVNSNNSLTAWICGNLFVYTIVNIIDVKYNPIFYSFYQGGMNHVR